MAIFEPVKTYRAGQYNPLFADVWKSGNPFGGGSSSPAAPAPAPGAGQSTSDAMYDPIKRLTEGRADELRKDPVQAEVIKYLQGVLQGQQQPYNDQVLNALQAQHGRQTATAEGAQMQQLRESLGATGGSIYDPSYQASQRELMSQRQGQNLDYGGQLNTQAALQNFNARQNAAGALAGVNQAQNSMINQLGLAGAGYQAQRFQEVPAGQGGSMPAAGVLMPAYNPAMQQQAAAPKTQAARAPAQSMMASPKPAAAPQQPQAQGAPLATQQQGTGQRQAQMSFGNPEYDPAFANSILRSLAGR
jgi:hypothetical protein